MLKGALDVKNDFEVLESLESKSPEYHIVLWRSKSLSVGHDGVL